MHRFCLRTQRHLRLPHPCYFCSPSLEKLPRVAENVENAQLVPSPGPRRHLPSPLSSVPASYLSHTTPIALSVTVVSAFLASIAFVSFDYQNQQQSDEKVSNPLYTGVEHAIHKSNDYFEKVFNHIKQTGVAASVLWQSLTSVLSSTNHGGRSGFEIRAAAFIADIAAANSSRRSAIVGAGGGAVVDWLLESVTVAKDGGGIQAESARALAYLIADPNVSAAVLGRPHAIPYLLRFIFSCHPRSSKKHSRRSSFDISNTLKGRSMLVAAIMDIVTSSCDDVESVSFKPSLPGSAETSDIAEALQVIVEGSLHLDEPSGSEDDDGGKGIKGIGIKVLDGTTALGLSKTSCQRELDDSDSSRAEPIKHRILETHMLQNKHDSLLAQENMSSAVVPSLWDDLHSEHVAVPFATWALANWAMASQENRTRIQELDQDGYAIMSALLAPERSVKWHASLVARLLLEDRDIPLNDSILDWSSSLLSTVSQACKHEDISLAQMALSAFLVSVERSPAAQRMIVMEKGLNLMRDSAKRTTKHKQVQQALAKAVELLCTGELHLSLEESQKWSGVLLPWVFGKFSSDATRYSAIKILSRILDDHGPLSVPISQGWLAILLTEGHSLIKESFDKATSQPKNDKVKTLINNSNVASAAQVANQLASAVVSLAAKQLGISSDSVDSFPLADLFSLEPFVGPFKNLKKGSPPKLDAADSALATLKGIKTLTEVCAEDSLCQDKIVDLGILCLLRRFLLSDDYEKLAAIEAYDASKVHEVQKRISNVDLEPPVSDNSDQSSVRVPPSAHIRRHAARLLNILSRLPKVQKVIIEDETWCKWLDDCANGRISGCSDLKIRSYARTTLLNICCNDQFNRYSGTRNSSDSGVRTNKNFSPRYDDMIFLINPHLPHWKSPKETSAQDTDNKDGTKPLNDDSLSCSINSSESSRGAQFPPIDVVFVHGLRGGPYKTWRIADDKSSTMPTLVEKIDQETGKLGTSWPGEWLSSDFPEARFFTLKYKTNLTQWSGASLPLQEVSSMLLEKLVAAGIGNRPVVFVTHSMGGLVVKQMMYKAKEESFQNLVNNTIGIVFYSCPHFGSKLADMPWGMGLVLRPAPTIEELRSGSARLVKLNDFIRHLHKKRMLDVLSFSETKVTPIVEGYGGWALRMEIVPIESAYPGFGELIILYPLTLGMQTPFLLIVSMPVICTPPVWGGLVCAMQASCCQPSEEGRTPRKVLESTDHINSCKPVSRLDPSYTATLEFLRKLKASYT